MKKLLQIGFENAKFQGRNFREYCTFFSFSDINNGIILDKTFDRFTAKIVAGF